MRRSWLAVALLFASPAQAGKDADGDGLKDKKDACPDMAEDLDGVQDEDGCPEWPVPLRPIHISKPGIPDPSCRGVIHEIEQSFDGKILRFICSDGTGVEARPRSGKTPQELVPGTTGVLHWVNDVQKRSLWVRLDTAQGQIEPER